LLGPIFNREVLTLPRRRKHYLTRSLYLFILWVLALTLWQATFGWGGEPSEGDLAYFGGLLFQLLSFLQLTLVLFFSALLAASAVAQEKDRRTFTLLLLTDLRNYEIVLGKLGGSLLQIGALTACALPVLALAMLLGGVSFQQVLLTALILAASGIAAGSLGGLLALWREKTFQTLALTVLCLVLYFLVVEGVGALAGDADGAWRARFNPFRTLASAVEPETEESLLETPAYSFTAIMCLLAFLMNTLGLWRLRAWNPRGEPIQQPETAEAGAIESETQALAERRDIHAAPGKVRKVWPNPILWREIRTRGYGAQAFLVKAAYLIVFALIVFWVYPVATSSAAQQDRLAAAQGLVPAMVLSLLVVNARAVTAITTERDVNSLELLLVTDLTPREFVFGKLGGIFYNTMETVLPPLLLTLAYGWWGLIGGETLVYVLISLLVLFAFTAVIGLHVGLHTVNTRLAIGYSLGTIFFLFVGTLICIYLILISGRFEYQWTSFIFFGVIGVGGLWVVIGRAKPSIAAAIACWLCPAAMWYTVTAILVGNPTTGKSGDPLIPFVVITFAFGFTIASMLVPLLSEFDVALGYSAPAEE
jgi:ABC-type transport system involved in multi-copper enzyme maturation permease subunit